MNFSCSKLSAGNSWAALMTGFVLSVSPAFAATITTPSTETFSGGSDGFNATPGSGTLDFGGVTYSVDGSGQIAIYNLLPFMGTNYTSVSGLGVVGDFNWSGTTTRNVHTFTFATNGGVKFDLNSLDCITGNAGPPTVFTVTGFSGATQKAQVTGLDLANLSSTSYAALSVHAIEATNIGPGDGSGFGQHLVFSGSGWDSIDRVVFSSTGNDLLLGLDNIQFANPVPEPAHLGLSAVALMGMLVRRRRVGI